MLKLHLRPHWLWEYTEATFDVEENMDETSNWYRKSSLLSRSGSNINPLGQTFEGKKKGHFDQVANFFSEGDRYTQGHSLTFLMEGASTSYPIGCDSGLAD
jgi:hypothetical protein